MTIDERNALRAASGLPLLNREREAQRAKNANDQVEFERRFSLERPRFAREWSGNKDGWLSNMGRWLRARQQVRREVFRFLPAAIISTGPN